MSLPAHQLFADDPDDRQDEAPPLAEGVAAWRQALSGSAAGAPSGAAGPRSPWEEFAKEENGDSFARWQERMWGCVSGKSNAVVAGVCQLLDRMEAQPEFREQCFVLAADAMGACDDRVALGFNHMWAALSINDAMGGGLSPEQLLGVSLKLFNRSALTEFALKHAVKHGIVKEELQVVLALETWLRDRLELPKGVPGMLFENFTTKDLKVTEPVLKEAVKHVQGRQQEPGAGGLKRFLAGQDAAACPAWADHLRKQHPAKFEKINIDVQNFHEREVAELGGTSDAHLKAAEKSKTRYQQDYADLVWQLTLPLLPAEHTTTAQAGVAQASPSGIPADRAADFQAAAAANRSGERLQRDDERHLDHSPRSSPSRSSPARSPR